MPSRINYEYPRIKTSVENQAILRSQGYTPVFSSNVSAIQRDGPDLYIRFHNGAVYVYPNQGSNYGDLLLSPSKGKWVWANLRRKNVAYAEVGNLPLDGDVDLTTEQLMSRLQDEGLLVQAIAMVEAFTPIFKPITILGSEKLDFTQQLLTTAVLEQGIKSVIINTL
jgi:hypothetical protein